MSREIPEEGAGFHVRHDGGAAVVTFDGPKLSLDQAQPLYRLVESDGHANLVLNFEHIQVLTSAPIGVIVNLGRKATAAGGAVKLCRLDPYVLEILRISRIATLFEIFDDEEAALASFRPD